MTVLGRPYWIEALIQRREGWDPEAYPFNLPVLRGLESIAFHPRVTFLVGENGSGKSTLIEALAVAWGFNAEGGSKDHRYSTRESHSPLHQFVRPVRAPIKARDGYFLRAESFFTTASYLEASGTSRRGQMGLHERSHGEIIASRATASISSMSQKPPCRPVGSCRFWPSCTSWCWPGRD
ncbi:AAA family ATPase [Caulobacter sp. DWR1-3-2b1]|uniref:AAA family ATPase n=1 Tax=Caulobacter sp. DWR1-3-2b1 TaxID=2804670 RepID=UPI003CF59B06